MADVIFVTMNSTAIQENFEARKNIKALSYTLAICATVFLLFFFISWTLPQLPPQPQDEGVEVNLGNSDQGMGDIAPMVPGEPSEAKETEVAPTTPVSQPAPTEEDNKLDEDNAAEATPINPSKPKTKPNPKSVTTPEVKKHTPKATLNTTPVKPKPKAVYAGGKNAGNGGNGADSYNGVRNQGIAGGNGDQGKPNGNPNSDSYTGNGGTGNSGVSIRSGLQGRRFRMPSFEDDFNENAKVAVDIKVTADGRVTSATINPRGTTTTSSNIKSIAIRKAQQLKFNNGSIAEQTGTIVFSFKLRE